MADNQNPDPKNVDLKVEGGIYAPTNVAGRDVNIFQNIVQNVPLPVLIGAIAALVIGFSVVGVILKNGLDEAVIDPTPTPPFAAASEDEVLVIVTNFTD